MVVGVLVFWYGGPSPGGLDVIVAPPMGIPFWLNTYPCSRAVQLVSLMSISPSQSLSCPSVHRLIVSSFPSWQFPFWSTQSVGWSQHAW